MPAEQPPILVLGSTGKTGRRVAQRLRAQGRPVRPGSRRATPAFDWEDRATWEPAFTGVDSIYVTFQPDLAVPGAADTIHDAARTAVRLGVQRLVLLSGRGEPEAQRCEAAIRGAGCSWTVLRSSWFAQNFDESFFRDPLIAGELALPVGAVPEPFVDADDVADAAVAALTRPDHAERTYELTGPRALSFEEAVGIIAAATARTMCFRTISPDAYGAMLRAAGLPDPAAELVLHLFATLFDGRNARPADGIERLLGRAPRDFGAYAATAAASASWSG